MMILRAVEFFKQTRQAAGGEAVKSTVDAVGDAAEDAGATGATG